MDPVIGRFYSTDPTSFVEGGVRYFNRYTYTANDPINGIDPDGEKVILIGGAGDKSGRGIISNYRNELAGKIPNEEVVYFENGNVASVFKEANSTPMDEPLVIIGHSWGASDAADATSGIDRPVDHLIGLDGVSKFNNDNPTDRSNIVEITHVEATGGGFKLDNIVKFIGRLIGGGKPDIFDQADNKILSDVSHGQARKMMGESIGGKPNSPSVQDRVVSAHKRGRGNMKSSPRGSVNPTGGYRYLGRDIDKKFRDRAR